MTDGTHLFEDCCAFQRVCFCDDEYIVAVDENLFVVSLVSDYPFYRVQREAKKVKR